MAPCILHGDGSWETMSARHFDSARPTWLSTDESERLDVLKPWIQGKRYVVPQTECIAFLDVLAVLPVFVGDPSRPVGFDEPGSSLTFQTQDCDGGILLRPALCDPQGIRISLLPQAFLHAGPSETIVFDGHTGFYRLPGGAPTWLADWVPGPVEIKNSKLAFWIDERYPQLKQWTEIIVGDAHTPELRRVAVQPVILVQESNEALLVQTAFQYPPEPQLVIAANTATVGSGPVRYLRDHNAEVEFTQMFWNRMPNTLRDLTGAWKLSGEDALHFLDETLPSFKNTAEIRQPQHYRYFPLLNGEPALHFTVNMEGDRFRIEFQVEVGERLYPGWEAWQAYKKGSHFARTRAGFLRVPQRALQKVAPLLEEISGGLLHRARLHLLTDLLLTYPNTSVDSQARRAIYADPKRRGQPVELPQGLQTQLRSYQEEGYRWLVSLYEQGFGGILADDMGLGKTVQTIAFLLAQQERLTLRSSKDDGDAELETTDFGNLLAAPSSVVYNWEREFERFAPSLRILPWRGSDRINQLHLMRKADVVLTSYSVLLRDQDILAQRRWRTVILDEAQAVKNADSKTAEAARSLPADFRLSITGTPIENNLEELWSQFQFIMPGFLGNLNDFRKRYLQAGDAKEAMASLRERISPFVLRRLKRDVAVELPPKTEIIHHVELDGEQRKLYEYVLAQYRDTLFYQFREKRDDSIHFHVFQALQRMRLLCCDPRLLAQAPIPGDSSLHPALPVREGPLPPGAKVDALFSLLEQALGEERKVLIFSSFLGVLDILEGGLEERKLGYARLDGSTMDRATPVERFQNERDCRVFLISLKAGGVGLNLTAADYIVHFDPWWNPAAEAQATDRAHRIGQTKPVFVYKLIARNTIEERVLELQQRKREIVDQMLGEESTPWSDPKVMRELLAEV